MEVLLQYPWPEPPLAHQAFLAEAAAGRLQITIDPEKIYELMIRETGGSYRWGLRFWGTLGLLLRSRTIHESNKRTAVDSFYRHLRDDANFYRIACGYGAITFPGSDADA